MMTLYLRYVSKPPLHFSIQGRAIKSKGLLLYRAPLFLGLLVLRRCYKNCLIAQWGSEYLLQSTIGLVKVLFLLMIRRVVVDSFLKKKFTSVFQKIKTKLLHPDLTWIYFTQVHHLTLWAGLLSKTIVTRRRERLSIVS
jgi:hypothetical protein